MPPAAALRHARRRRIEIAIAVAVLFAVVLGLRFAIPDPQQAVSLLYVVPIALAAAEFGVVGGLVSATLAYAFFVGWRAWAGADLGLFLLIERGLVFYLLGGVVGRITELRRRVADENDLQWELSIDLMCTAGFDGYFKRTNPAFTRVLGYSEAELLHHPFVEFVHPEDRDRTAREAERLTQAGTVTLDFQNRYRARDGSYHWLEWRASSRPDQQLIYAMARDVSDRKELEHELHEMARHDPLSGLLNRRGFLEVLVKRVAETQRYGVPAALLAIDLDGFKAINDDLGHAAGDEVLLCVAQSLRESLRTPDVAGRPGGDEFMVLLPETTADAAHMVAERVVQGIGASMAALGRKVTASGGVVAFAGEGVPEVEAWLAAADSAMYQAKRAGGNRVVLSL